MIAQKHRFHGHNSVSRVRGSSVRTPTLHIFYARSKQRADFRMAIVVSKKIAKSAVVRNRIRRRLYELVRKSNVFDGVPVDAVFVVKDVSLATCDSTVLELQVQNMCQKVVDSTHK